MGIVADSSASGYGRLIGSNPPAIAVASDEPLMTVSDELCPDTDFYNYLETQKKIREAEIRKLTQNRNFGFKPKNSKPPF